MPKPKKNKKALIQFAIAGVVALVVAGIVIMLVFMIIFGLSQSAQSDKEALNTQLEEVQQELERMKKRAKKNPQVARTITEIRAVAAIPAGSPITRNLVASTQVKDKEAFPNSFRRLNDVLGKLASADIEEGETLTRQKIADGSNIYLIPSGQRAMAIRVGNTESLGNQLVVGAYVDVLITIEPEGSQAVTKTLLQRVKVIGVEKPEDDSNSNTRQRQRGEGHMITLAVNPEEAEMLVLANKKGTFHLTLRSFEDKEVKSLYGSDIGQLVLGKGRSQLVQPLPALPDDVTDDLANILVSDPGNLQVAEPSSSGGGASSGGFSMEVYKGANSERLTFDRQP